MTLAFTTTASSDQELLIPAVAGNRIRLLRLTISTSTVRWITISSSTSELIAGTQIFPDIQLSNFLASDLILGEEYAITSAVGEGMYYTLSSPGGKTDIGAWYDLVP